MIEINCRSEAFFCDKDREDSRDDFYQIERASHREGVLDMLKH